VDTDNNGIDFFFVDTKGTSAAPASVWRARAEGLRRLFSAPASFRCLADATVSSAYRRTVCALYQRPGEQLDVWHTLDSETISQQPGGPVTRLRLNHRRDHYPGSPGIADQTENVRRSWFRITDPAVCASWARRRRSVPLKATTLEEWLHS
jgi:hypothetical protein